VCKCDMPSSPLLRWTGLCRWSWNMLLLSLIAHVYAGSHGVAAIKERGASARDHQSRPRYLQRLSSGCLTWRWMPPILGRWCSKKVLRETASWREWRCVYVSPYRERGEVASPWWELSERQREGRLRVEQEEHAQLISQPLLWDLLPLFKNIRCFSFVKQMYLDIF
jgi:hypothetical protein